MGVTFETMGDEKVESNFFKCEDCSRCFPMRMDYNRHRKMVHDKRFICTICNRKYGLRTDLQRHQTIHQLESEKVKYECTFAGCDFKGASRRTYLKKHMIQKHHSVDPAAFGEALDQSTKDFSRTSNNSKNFNFLLAVSQGNEEEVQAFILEGVDISWKDPHGLTARHIAIKHKQINILKMLLQKDISEWPFELLLRDSLVAGGVDMLKFLLEHGAANITETTKLEALKTAGQAGQKAIAQILLDNGARLGSSGYLSDFKEVHIDIIRMIASHTLPTDKISFGGTLLHPVAIYHEHLIGELLERGFDVDAKDVFGDTPLSYALGSWGAVNEKAARILLDAGATISSREWGRMSPDLLTEYADRYAGGGVS